VAFPASLQLVTVHGGFDLLPSGAMSGTVRFAANFPALNGPTDNRIVPFVDETVSLDRATGDFTKALPATNDPQWSPSGWNYTVTLSTGARTRTGTLELDYQTTSVELADLIQWDGTASAGTTYASLAQLAATQAEVDAAEVATAALTTSAPAGLVKASAHGLVGWTFDPAMVQAGTVQPTAGLAQVARIQALGPTVTNILFHFTAGGSGLTGAYAALFNDAGALLGAGAVTNNQASAESNWGTGGFKTCPLSVAQGVTPYAWYRAFWWFTGTTGATISRAVNSSSVVLNAGLSAPGFRFSTADSGLTTTPPSNIGSQTGGPTAWWVGLS
jgi:hypothetical protein